MTMSKWKPMFYLSGKHLYIYIYIYIYIYTVYRYIYINIYIDRYKQYPSNIFWRCYFWDVVSCETPANLCHECI